MTLLNKKEIQQYLYTNRPRYTSVHYGQTARFEKAKEQASLMPVPVQKIIEYCNEFLRLCDIQRYSENYISLKERSPEEINESAINEYGLNHPQDIIWLKFTTDGYLGVVAMSNDINFDIPPSPSSYDEREKYLWKYTTSGIIVDYFGKNGTNPLFFFFLSRVSRESQNAMPSKSASGTTLLKKVFRFSIFILIACKIKSIIHIIISLQVTSVACFFTYINPWFMDLTAGLLIIATRLCIIYV